MADSFLRFTVCEPEVKIITTIWVVDAVKSNAFLGTIRWHGAWRKYCFFPLGDTMFDPNCLREIAQFIDDQMAERKKSSRGKESK